MAIMEPITDSNRRRLSDRWTRMRLGFRPDAWLEAARTAPQLRTYTERTQRLYDRSARTYDAHADDVGR